MNKQELLSYLSKIDAALKRDSTLCVYGSAAFILLDEEDRTSLDIDVAAPYSDVDFDDLKQAAEKAGLSINPDEAGSSEHIEWISPLRLCLSRPDPETEILLWSGKKLKVKTVSSADLVASKLIRYDEIDQSDIQYLCTQTRMDFESIEAAVKSLPAPFDRDVILLENLRNLESDLQMWNESEP